MDDSIQLILRLFPWLACLVLVIVLAMEVNSRDICRNQLSNCVEIHSNVISAIDQPADNLPLIVRE